MMLVVKQNKANKNSIVSQSMRRETNQLGKTTGGTHKKGASNVVLETLQKLQRIQKYWSRIALEPNEEETVTYKLTEPNNVPYGFAPQV